jgi:hypothetical protein
LASHTALATDVLRHLIDRTRPRWIYVDDAELGVSEPPPSTGVRKPPYRFAAGLQVDPAVPEAVEWFCRVAPFSVDAEVAAVAAGTGVLAEVNDATSLTLTVSELLANELVRDIPGLGEHLQHVAGDS